MRKLCETKFRLKLLKEEIEPFIDNDSLGEEYATNLQYEDEIIHVMIRLYYQVKEEELETIDQCQMIRTLKSSKTFQVFFNDRHDL